MNCKHPVLLIIFIVYQNGNFANGKTASEFTVAVSTNDYKEIHIPIELWKSIVNHKSLNKFQKSENTSLLRQSNVNLKYDKKQIDNSENIVEEGEDISTENRPVNEITLEISSPTESDIIDPINTQVNAEKPVDIKPEEAVGVNSDSVLVPSDTDITKPEVEPVVAEPIVDTVANAGQQSPIPESVVPASDPVSTADPEMVVVNSTRAPCKCAMGTCSCCVTVIRQKGCANVKFLPEEFSFEMEMTMNGNLVTRRKLPLSDPPPICFNPRRAPFLELCARINNIHIKEQNVHLCVDIDANVGDFDLLSWNYNCLKFGRGGLITGLDPDTVTIKPKPDEDDDEDDDDDDDDDEGGGFFSLFGGGDDDDDDEGGLFDFFDDDDDY